MADPQSTTVFIITILKDIFTAIIEYGFLFLILGAIAAGIYFVFFANKKKRVDQIEKIRRTHIELAKRQKTTEYEYLKHLYRVPVSFESIAAEDEQKMRKYLNYNNAVYIGDVVGFNKIDWRAKASDIIQINKTGTKDKTTDHVEGIVEDAKKIEKKLGDTLYVIVYQQPKSGGILSLGNKENIMLVTESQMIAYRDKINGKVVIAGHGTDRLGNFDIITGQAEAYPFLLSQFKSMAEADTTMGVLSDMRNMVNKAIDLDSTPEKFGKALSSISQMIRGGRDEK